MAPVDTSLVQGVLQQVARRVVGQEYMVERLLISLLTGGHVLLEGVPGLAKTLTVKTLAETISTTFHRIQFTPDLLPADVLGTRCLVGGLAHGVIGAGQEDEGTSGVSVLAVAGLDARSVWIPDLEGQEEVVADELLAQIGGAPRPEDLVVLVPDPRALRAEPLVAGVWDAVGPAGVVGAGAADPVSEAPLVWCGREAEGGALAGLVLRGASGLRVGVTQACRPATGLLTVTRASGPWVLEIDGRPALVLADVRDALEELGLDVELALARHLLEQPDRLLEVALSAAAVVVAAEEEVELVLDRRQRRVLELRGRHNVIHEANRECGRGV